MKASGKHTRNKGGQPTKHKPEYNDQVVKLCRLGATDAQIADFFNVTETTINNWKKQEPQFFESIKKGKLYSDATIANSLYYRAKGYEHPAVKFFVIKGKVIRQDYTEHYPPDTAAAFVWLKNRQPEKWRDKIEHEHSGKNGEPLTFEVIITRPE